MQNRCNAGKKGFRIGGIQGLECRTVRMQDRRDTGKERYRKGGNPDQRVTLKEILGGTRGIWEWKYTGNEGKRLGGFRTVGKQHRRDAGQAGYRTGGMQDWRYAGKEARGKVRI